MRGCGSRRHSTARRTLVLLVLLVLTLVSAGRADAQWNGFVHINGSVQTDDRTVTHGLAQGLYGETATYEATMTSPGGSFVDAWAGVRVWGDVGIALGATVLNARGATAVSGSVPSPLFRNRHRTAPSFERPGLNHQQVGVHLPLVYVLPVSERIHVAVSAGPSWYRLRHDEITAVTLGTEAAPYDAVEIADLTTAVDEGSGFGYNAGLDVTYLLIRNVGVGLFLRYTGGSVKMDFPDGTKSVEVGGAQGGAGLRFRF